MGESGASLGFAAWRSRMNISSMNYRPTPAFNTTRSSEATEAPGPDHDGDSDDMGAAAAPSKASVGAGIGQQLDMVA